MSKYQPSTSAPTWSPNQPPGQSRQFDTVPLNIMKTPGRKDFCPPGLECLTVLDQLVVQQRVNSLELILGYNQKNSYRVFNNAGQGIYYASEESGLIMRQMCGHSTPFTMHIWDNSGVEVMRLQRHFGCTTCWCPCFLNRMEVEAPPGTPIGRIQQRWHMFLPTFDVLNAHGLIIAKIKGPLCQCVEASFNIFKPDGHTSIGVIRKKWSGVLKETFTKADNFGITFPMGMDPSTKAIMLGACFLIDYMYFE